MLNKIVIFIIVVIGICILAYILRQELRLSRKQKKKDDNLEEGHEFYQTGVSDETQQRIADWNEELKKLTRLNK